MAVSKINASFWEDVTGSITWHGVGVYNSGSAYLNRETKMLLICGGTANIPNQSPLVTLPASMTPKGSEVFADLVLTIIPTNAFTLEVRYTSTNRIIRSAHSQNVSASYGYHVLIPLA